MFSRQEKKARKRKNSKMIEKINKLEEKRILEDKDLFSQIVASEKNIKKGKIKVLANSC